jgi:hypothetical protein
MADKWPLANGNWSNAANWNSGTLPAAGDDVYADGKTVTIDQDVTVLSIRNTQRTGGTANGGFQFATAQTTYNITADLIGFNANLMSLNQSSRTYNFTGNIEQVQGVGQSIILMNVSSTNSIANITGNINCIGGANDRTCISASGLNSEINIIGNVTAGGTVGGDRLSGILTANNVIINITGNITATGNASTSLTVTNQQRCININSASTVNITGNVIGNTSVSGGQCIFISSTSSNLNINGDVIGVRSFSSVVGTIIYNNAPNTARISKIIGSSTGTGVAVYNLTTSNVIVDTFEFSNIATVPAVGKVLISNTNFTLIATDESSNTAIFTEDNNVLNFIPNEDDVRLNTTYYDGLKTGSLNVPDPSNVRNGVPTDNTVGTADLTAQDFFDAIATSSDPVAIRLRNVATVETTGDQISAFNV